MNNYIIHRDYPGGNILVNDISDDVIVIEQDTRDTIQWWFYWNFCAENMQGKTITFKFANKNVISDCGPCTSVDRVNWEWCGTECCNGRSEFTFSFDENDNKRYFAFSIPYQLDDYNTFINKYPESQIQRSFIGKSEKGRDIPLMQFGNPKSGKNVYFTCRHHACESPAAYVLEGVVEQIVKNSPMLMENFYFHVFPFADLDGVECGDQGKYRIPHDHNRDYSDYPCWSFTRCVQSHVKEYPPIAFMDYHSPYIYGERHEMMHIVKNMLPMGGVQDCYSLILERIAAENYQEGDLPYCKQNNLEFGVEWNTTDILSHTNASAYFQRSGAKFVCSIEVPYSLYEKKVPCNKDNLRRFGKFMSLAYEEYFKFLLV